MAGYAAAGSLPGNSQYLSSISADIKADYGARGDGLTDDTDAFERFVRDARGRAVLQIPPGMRGSLARTGSPWPAAQCTTTRPPLHSRCRSPSHAPRAWRLLLLQACT